MNIQTRHPGSLSTMGEPSSRGEIVIPKQFRQDCLDVVCEYIREGRPIKDACAEDGMPSPTFIRKCLDRSTEFQDRYINSARTHCLSEAGNILLIADDVTEETSRSRLRIDTRLKMLEKLIPEVFKHKVEVQHTVFGELRQVIADSRTHIDKPPGVDFIEGESVSPHAIAESCKN